MSGSNEPEELPDSSKIARQIEPAHGTQEYAPDTSVVEPGQQEYQQDGSDAQKPQTEEKNELIVANSDHKEGRAYDSGVAPGTGVAPEITIEETVDDSRVSDAMREAIENEASTQLASRAAGLSFEPSAAENSSPMQSPPLPVRTSSRIASTDPRGKSKMASASAQETVAGRDISQPVNDTGSEIQSIMDQFQQGVGPGMEEIMSPRLEMAQPNFRPPPRSSSLEPTQNFALSPQTTGQSVRSLQSQHSAKTGSISGASLERVTSPGAESTHSHAPSIFQPPPPSPDPESPLPFDFHRFLEQLRHRTADPVARFLRSFLLEFGKKSWMVHEQVKILSDFLEFISKKMAQCEVWQTVSDAEFDNAREGMEKLVMNRLYSQTFSPAIPSAEPSPRKGKTIKHLTISPHGPGRRGQHQEDVERDDVIAQKIRIYGWIREEHLDIKQVGEKGRKFLVLAQQELLKINTYRAPRDKIICVLNCCKVIFGFLRNSKGDQSADAFIPLMIYTVLRAAPEHLVSNIQYIWRFRNQDKLGGEAGYYMSSLMGVVTFIENLDRTNLTITDEEFEHNVEQAVSAFAEGHKAEGFDDKTRAASGPSPPTAPMQHLSEKSALSRAEVTPRHSMDAERSSPKRNVSQRLSEKDNFGASDEDDTDAVTDLLRTIQKPLSSIGRLFSDEGPSEKPQIVSGGLRTAVTGSTPRGLSPAPRLERRTSGDAKADPGRDRSRQKLSAEDAAARQASAETAEAQRVRAQENTVVVETLQGMFPDLDKEVIEDVVRMQEGNVGKAVDACLALSA